MSRSDHVLWLLPVLSFAVATVALPARSADPPEALKLPADAPLAPDVRQLTRGLRLSSPPEAWVNPRPDREKPRDASAPAVYAKAAPAVVVVRAGNGHGTGFVVGTDGWLVTNYHVVEDAETDPATGAGRALIHLGELVDGVMKLNAGPPLEALVYKSSAKDDLALLKLTDPEAAKRLPAPLAVAAKPPLAGTVCHALGHPGVGLLWSIRPGTVSSVGDFPQERSDLLLAQIHKSERDAAKVPAVGASVPRRKTVFSNCLIYGGDSGGPLLNADGEVIAVTYAVAARHGQAVPGFSYHVHRDLLVAFLKDKPAAPAVSVPDVWPAASRFSALDIDKDGTPETLVFVVTGGEGDQKITGVLIDPDQKSAMPSREAFSDPAKRDAWRFRLAVHLYPRKQVFYDTDGDGKIDLILIDSKDSGTPDAQLTLTGDKWVRSAAKSKKLIDPTLLKLSDESRDRLERILKKVGK